ncbi:MAG: FeoB-associated Cys-rich membrane protein [Lachnospiraceae bacterium]|nr:FeoB-associated Cys-rich membrane protein [Lachnospiraceae bacterium]
MGTLIVIAVLVLIVGLIIRGMVKDKRNGKSIQCGGDCSHCGGHCSHS